MKVIAHSQIHLIVKLNRFPILLFFSLNYFISIHSCIFHLNYLLVYSYNHDSKGQSLLFQTNLSENRWLDSWSCFLFLNQPSKCRFYLWISLHEIVSTLWTHFLFSWNSEISFNEAFTLWFLVINTTGLMKPLSN